MASTVKKTQGFDCPNVGILINIEMLAQAMEISLLNGNKKKTKRQLCEEINEKQTLLEKDKSVKAPTFLNMMRLGQLKGVENCTAAPSKGGPSADTVKKAAEEKGIKGKLKSDLCLGLVEKGEELKAAEEQLQQNQNRVEEEVDRLNRDLKKEEQKIEKEIERDQRENNAAEPNIRRIAPPLPAPEKRIEYYFLNSYIGDTLYSMYTMYQKYKQFCLVFPSSLQWSAERELLYVFKDDAILHNLEPQRDALFQQAFKICKQKKGIYWFPITLQYKNEGHFNIVLFRKEQRKIELYDPHNSTDAEFKPDAFYAELKRIFSLPPFSANKFVFPNEGYCKKNSIQSFESDQGRAALDPSGFCVAWSFMRLNITLENPAIDDVDKLDTLLLEQVEDAEKNQQTVTEYASLWSRRLSFDAYNWVLKKFLQYFDDRWATAFRIEWQKCQLFQRRQRFLQHKLKEITAEVDIITVELDIQNVEQRQVFETKHSEKQLKTAKDKEKDILEQLKKFEQTKVAKENLEKHNPHSKVFQQQYHRYFLELQLYEARKQIQQFEPQIDQTFSIENLIKQKQKQKDKYEKELKSMDIESYNLTQKYVFMMLMNLNTALLAEK